MEKLSKIIDVLKSKWMRNTGKTIILIAIIIGLFLGINILMQHIDPKDIDLTKEKIYTLSEESKKVLAELPDSDQIKIYMFDFKEDDTSYAYLFKKVTVKNKEELQLVMFPNLHISFDELFNIE